MTRIHFSALSDRWSSAANTDAFFADTIGKYYVFGVAEGMSNLPGTASASGVAISCLVHSVQEMNGLPAAALKRAVYESEAQIHAQKKKTPEQSRDATHLSACITDESMECTILDTGEGNVFLIGPEGIDTPGNFPNAVPLRDPKFLAHGSAGEKAPGNMISHTLGEPHMLKLSDFVTVTIQDIFVVVSSGGLHDFVPTERIAEIVNRNSENVETACQQLVQEAQRAGAERTITVVLIHGHKH